MTETTERTTHPHEWYQDLLGAYALDAVLPDEAAEMERHLRRCPTCRAELRLWRTAVHAQALLAEERAPSPDLRARLQAAIMSPTEQQPASAPLPEPVSLQERRKTGGLGTLPTWSKMAAALAVVLIGSLIAWNISLRNDASGDQGRVVGQFAATADAPSPSLGGDIRYIEDENLLVIEMHDLPALPANEVYQLWLVHGDAVSPSVTFQAGTGAGDSTRVAVVSDPSDLDALAITREPGPIGSVSATTPIILLAEV
jgi:hypothetical protein